jgi:putative ABC transport system permease protein
VAALKDLQYSARSLARTPGLALALLATIALGIGGNASVFGFIHGSVTPNLPLAGIETVVSIFGRDAQDALGPVSYEGYLLLKTHTDVFELVGAARESQANVVVGDRASFMSVAAVTQEMTGLLHFSLGDGAIISDRLWRLSLDGTGVSVGQQIRVDGVDTLVAGVAPGWLDGLYRGRAVDIWMPLHEASLGGVDRGSSTFWTLARRRPGVSIDHAQAALISKGSGARPIAVFPYTGATPEAAVGLSRIGGLLTAAAGAVFFMACANVATFLLSRASARSHETSVRVALGARRGQLAAHLISDSVVISVAGAALGTLLAVWTAQIIPALFYDQDADSLVFAPALSGIVEVSLACAVITIACGLMPLIDIRHDDPAAILQRESAGPSNAMRRLRAVLVVAQMTLCSLLVISTGLLVKGLRSAVDTGAGHRFGRPILATLEARGFDHPELGLVYFHEAERAVRSLAGITATAWVGALPGSRPTWQSVRIEPSRLPVRNVVMSVGVVTPPSPLPFTLPPIVGRMFGGRDMAEACPVVLVNEEAVNELFDGDAVGRAVEDIADQRVQIIGVVSTRKKAKTTARSRPTVYYYDAQTGTPLGVVGPSLFRVPARPKPASGVLNANVASSGYFGAMGLSLVEGTVFPDDPAPRSCRVGVINQEAAELYFGGEAVGGAVIDGGGRRTEIIGVVHSALLRAAQRREEPTIYLPLSQDFLPRMTLILSAPSANNALLASVRRRLDAVPGGASGGIVVTTLDAHLSRTVLAPERLAMGLVGASAATGLALGALGLYGIMADAARQRRREIAVRVALGAQRWRVIGELLAEGVRLAVAGTVAGSLGSILVSRWLTRIAPHAGELTVWVWLVAPLALVGAVAIASVLPAWRALGVNPLTILRDN